jgi:hypothetical protein
VIEPTVRNKNRKLIMEEARRAFDINIMVIQLDFEVTILD